MREKMQERGQELSESYVLDQVTRESFVLATRQVNDKKANI